MIKKEIINHLQNCKTISFKEYSKLQFNDLKEAKDRDVTKLKNSLVNEGFIFPVYKWKRYIIDGTGRDLALKSLNKEGYTICDIPYLEIPANNLEHAKKRILMLNSQHGIISQESLNNFIKDIDLTDIQDCINIPNLELNIEVPTPISENHIEELDQEVIPEIESVETNIKEGDLIILGPHRILCGDATISSNIDKLMNNQQSNFIYCDPPYGMNLQCDKQPGKHRQTSNVYNKVIGDDKPFDPTFILNHFKDSKEIFLWGADYYMSKLPSLALGKGSLVVWDKRAGIEDMNWSNSEFELCWSKNKHHRKIARVVWSGFNGLQNEKDELTDKGQSAIKRTHPNQKPVRLHKWFFENWLGEESIIVDLFLGTGSTLIACEVMNKSCYGMEIDPRYCQLIVDRWERLTGQTVKIK